VADEGAPDLGDLVVALVAASLAGLSERLLEDGFARSAQVIDDLIELADGYLSRIGAGS
jgi:hypothetical protein